jgi:type IV pilus assembly protein PilM
MATRFPPVLVIDCGASRVSATSFGSTTDGTPVVRAVHVESLDTETTDDLQWARAVGDAIRRIVTQRRMRGPVTLIVPGHLTLTKFIRVPHVDEARREKIIQFEARQNIPYPLEEVVWDYQIVYDDGVDFEVALCAIKLDIVNALLAECREAGIEPAVIEPSCMAQVNALRFCFPQARQSTLLINIGARSSNLLFFREDRFFVRNITLGGGTVSQSLADELGQGLTEAERIKRELSARGVTSATPPAVAAAYDNARQGFAGRLALEVTRSIANFRRQGGGEAPVAVYLTGAASAMPELGALLADKLKLPVQPYEPLRGVPIDPHAVEGEIRAAGHLIGESVGSALRVYAQGLATVNLLPASVLEARAFRKKQPMLLGALAFVAGALAVGLLVGGVTLSAYRVKIATLEDEARPLRRYSSEVQRLRDETETLRREIAGIKGLVDTKANWISFFGDLQARLVKVEDVWLDKVQVLRPQTQVQTSVISGSLFAGLAPRADQNATGQPAQTLRLNLTGRLIDKNHPTSVVSQESRNRVKTLLESFKESEFILSIEDERFDTSQPGILRFDFIMEVDPKRPL